MFVGVGVYVKQINTITTEDDVRSRRSGGIWEPPDMDVGAQTWDFERAVHALNHWGMSTTPWSFIVYYHLR